jgi:ribosomal protein S18 acetylase RimI-like enzyme
MPKESAVKNNEGISIRKMTMDDYEQVLALWEEGDIPLRPQGRDSRENMQRQLQQPVCFYYVAETKERIIGVILGTHDGRKGWINRLAVAPSYRRRGIATRLVHEVEQHLTVEGIDIVASLIEDWNEISMKMFERFGYTRHTDIHYFSKRKNPKV